MQPTNGPDARQKGGFSRQSSPSVEQWRDGFPMRIIERHLPIPCPGFGASAPNTKGEEDVNGNSFPFGERHQPSIWLGPFPTRALTFCCRTWRSWPSSLLCENNSYMEYNTPIGEVTAGASWLRNNRAAAYGLSHLFASTQYAYNRLSSHRLLLFSPYGAPKKPGQGPVTDRVPHVPAQRDFPRRKSPANNPPRDGRA